LSKLHYFKETNYILQYAQFGVIYFCCIYLPHFEGHFVKTMPTLNQSIA